MDSRRFRRWDSRSERLPAEHSWAGRPLAPELGGVVAAMRRVRLPPGAGWHEQRAQLEQATSAFEPPIGMRREPEQLNGVPVEVVGTPEQLNRPRRIIHFHGGGYVLGSPLTNRPIVCSLAAAADTAVVSVDYRRAPENPYPAAVEDACSAYVGLLESFAPASVVMSGDSAGGGLAVATAMAIRDDDRRMPAGLLGFSPWLDLSLSSGPADVEQEVDPQIDRELLVRMADAYLQGADPRSSGASPLFGELTGLPPVLIQVGTHELLRDDALRFFERAREEEVDVTLEVFDGMIHVWHSLAPRLESANLAFASAGEWLRERIPAFDTVCS